MRSARSRARSVGRARWWSKRRQQEYIARVIWIGIALVWLLMGLDKLGLLK